MLTTLQKWGNSLGLRIPKAFAEEAGVAEGSAVDISLVRGEIVVRPVRRPKYALAELVDRIGEGNRHDEIATGDPRGREVW